MSRIALCADAESLAHPVLLGLEGERIDGLDWLVVYTEAAQAREEISRARDIDEVWVASCDGMDPINLAAALKYDDADKRVFLISGDATGSFLSRAQSAGLNGTLTSEGFSRRYASEKRIRGCLRDSRQGNAKEPAFDDVNEEDFDFSERLPPSSCCQPYEAEPERAKACERAHSSQAHAAGAGKAGAVPSEPAVLASGVVLVVASAGGGVGKSAFSTLAACLFSQNGFNTVLVDADLISGDAAVLAGEKAPTRFESLVEDGRSLAECALPDKVDVAGFSRCAAGYAVVAAPERIEVGEALRSSVDGVVERLSALFDVVVVNADAVWDERMVELLERSTKTVCLIGQRMSSVRMAQKIMALCSRCGVAVSSLNFVLNGCSKDAAFSVVDVSCALQGQRVLGLDDGGRIVEELLGVGMPSSLAEEGNAFFLSVAHSLEQMFPDLLHRGFTDGEKRKGRKVGLFGGVRKRAFLSGEKEVAGYGDDAA